MQGLWLKKLSVSMAVGIAFTAQAATLQPKAITAVNKYEIAQVTQSSTKLATPAAPLLVSLPEIKLPDKLDLWLDKLVYRESRARSDIKILDLNGRYSYGCLQFQYDTLVNYSLKYDLMTEDTTTREVTELLYDCDYQKKLARLMIQEDWANWRHWYTSVSKTSLGYPPRLKSDPDKNHIANSRDI